MEIDLLRIFYSKKKKDNLIRRKQQINMKSMEPIKSMRDPKTRLRIINKDERAKFTFLAIYNKFNQTKLLTTLLRVML